MKNNKGFTLIELMIAIAIIGILALVLIPKVAGLKDSAREQGLDTNVRMGLSVAEGLLDTYTADATGCADIETALSTKLPLTAKNPFTKVAGVKQTTGGSALATGDAAFAYTVDLAATEVDSQTPATDATKLPGVVMFDAAVVSGKLVVTFTPYDGKGVAVVAKVAATN